MTSRGRPFRRLPDNSPQYSPARWANQLLGALGEPTRDAFHSDPKRATVEQLGLTLSEATALGQSRDGGGWCDGVSFTEAGVILYAVTPWSRRENFTIAHEVGHHLVDGDENDDLWDWLADHPDRSKFIEATCDAIARRLLLPRSRVDQVLSGGPVSGASVAALYAASEASREVCAIAIAERLGCEGFVLLAKADTETVTFASRSDETRPCPWRGDRLPVGHPLSSLRVGDSKACESWWPTRAKVQRRFYQHAVRDIDDWIYAVFAENDLWGAARLHLPEPAQQGLRRFQVRCPCGFNGTTTSFPCPTCRKPPCPTCGCDCDRRAALPTDTCERCFRRVRSHLLVDHLCDDCR